MAVAPGPPGGRAAPCSSVQLTAATQGLRLLLADDTLWSQNAIPPTSLGENPAFTRWESEARHTRTCGRSRCESPLTFHCFAGSGRVGGRTTSKLRPHGGIMESPPPSFFYVKRETKRCVAERLLAFFQV